MKEHILIFGSLKDPHIKIVSELIKERNFDVHVFDYLHKPLTTFIKYSHLNGKFDFILSTDGVDIRSENVLSAWWRLKPIIISNPKNENEYLTKTFRDREWKMCMDYVTTVYNEKFRLNSVLNNQYAKNKLQQLTVAEKVGFAIPDTIISNNSELIIDFSDKKEDIIYKSLTWYFEPPDKILFTNKIDTPVLEKDINSVQICPSIYQQQIQKKTEYRITIVGNEVFATRIYSQEGELSQLDWRRDQFEIKYEAFTLEKNFGDKLIQLHNLLKLEYGAYDFIESKSGEIYFLEVNPMGQWLFIENKTGQKISKAIANTLTKKI